MLAHSKLLLERGHIAINPKFDKLVTALRTAVDNEGTLDKDATSYNDIFDAFRLNLIWYSSGQTTRSESEHESESNYDYEDDTSIEEVGIGCMPHWAGLG